MNFGGVELSLIQHLKRFSDDKQASKQASKQARLFLYLSSKRGDAFSLLPSDVEVKIIWGMNKYFRCIVDDPYTICRRFLKSLKLGDLFGFVKAYFKQKKANSQIPMYEFMYRKEKVDPVIYDEVYVYGTPFPALEYFALNYVKSKKYATWIHFDVNKFGINNSFVNSYYHRFDDIILVSNELKKIFDNRFPALASHTKVVHNLIDKDSILKQSEEIIGDMPTGKCDHIRIVTVGRVSEEKGQYDVLPYFKEAIDNDLNAVWYFVGGGKDLERCKQKTEELGIADNVKFLGVKTNPYPYMRHCDVYVQPSRHEGYCITLAEAKLFNKPIITTQFTGAKEQLKNYEYSASIISIDKLSEILIEYANNIGDYSNA